MNDVLAHTIPVSGERYHVTLDKVGSKGGAMYARWIIDRGQYRGKTVSCSLEECKNVILLGLDGTDLYGSLDEPKFVFDLNKQAKRIRATAFVHVKREAAPNGEWISVDEEYRESNVRVTYTMADFEEADEPSELKTVFSK